MPDRVRGFSFIVSAAVVLVAIVIAASALRAEDVTSNAPPHATDWASLAKLPDWSGVWTPYMSDQEARIKSDPVPWKPPRRLPGSLPRKQPAIPRGYSSIAYPKLCPAGCLSLITLSNSCIHRAV